MDDELSGSTIARHLSRRKFLATAAAGFGGATVAGLTSSYRASAATRGYYVPIDSRRHTRTWMAWPDSKHIWGSALEGVQDNIALVASTIARYEPVIVCANRASVAAAHAACGAAVDVIGDVPVNDCWMRDSGPIFRVNRVGRLDVVGLNFNGWGDKQVHDRDALVARRVAEILSVRFTAAGFVSEGGAIECNGHGTLMATRSSIINPNRNRGMTRAQIEAAMCAAYGAAKVIWFRGIVGQDITDDHVDATSRFLAGGKAVVQYPPHARDHDIWSNDERRQYHVLSRATNAQGVLVKASKLIGPIWREIRQHRNPGFVDSYVNYYVCNGAVLAAQFGDARGDAAAAATLARIFPGRVIEQLNIDNLGNGGGGVHCVTQPQPAP